MSSKDHVTLSLLRYTPDGRFVFAGAQRDVRPAAPVRRRRVGRHKPAVLIRDNILTAVRRHMARQEDDMTLMVIRYRAS